MDSLGPYKLNQIYAGNAKDLLIKLPDACIDLTVTSPPYDNLRDYKGYIFDFRPIAAELFRVTKQGGIVVWVVGDATVNGSETGTSFRQALRFMGLGFKLHDTMIYHVDGTGAKGSNYAYWQAFEYMFVLSRGRPKTVNRLKDRKNKKAGQVNNPTPKASGMGTRVMRKNIITPRFGFRTNVWTIHPTNRSDRTDHPAPFPEALARDHILSWSNPGDVVLDPLCGSGTTLKMAKQLGRLWIGFDISEEYVGLARLRVRQANPPLFTI